MNQAEAANSLLGELKRLRGDGVRDLYVEEESLLSLEKALRANFGEPISRGNAETPSKTTPHVSDPSTDSKVDERKQGIESSPAPVLRAFTDDDDKPSYRLPSRVVQTSGSPGQNEAPPNGFEPGKQGRHQAESTDVKVGYSTGR